MTDRNTIKTLLLDMEVSYAIYYAFPSKREQYLSPKNIIHDQFCLCAAWKWEHEVSVQSVKVTDDKKRFKKNFRDDFVVAKKLHELITEADVVVAHNGDAFDMKWANTLFRKHGLGPVPDKKTIDTLKAARKHFMFAGNDLDTLSKRFGGDGKNQKPCWKKLTDGDASEIALATRYCKNDVLELERVFLELRPYMKRLPKIPSKGDIIECEACGSKRLKNHGTRFDGTRFYKDIRCQECKHPHKGKVHKK